MQRFYQRAFTALLPLLASSPAHAQDKPPALVEQSFSQPTHVAPQRSSSLVEANALMAAGNYEDAVRLLESILYQTNIHYSSARQKADLYHALGTAYHHASRPQDAKRALLFTHTLYRDLEAEPLTHAALLVELAQIEAEAMASTSGNQEAAIQTYSTLQAGYLRQAISVLGATPSQAHLSQMADLSCQLAELYQARNKRDTAAKLRQSCMQARSRHAIRNIGAQQQAMLAVLATLTDPEDWNDPNPADPIVSKPVVTNQLTPDYPVIARRLGQEGIVEVLIHIDSKGEPSRVAIAASSGYPRLDASAIAAIQQWQFSPARTKSGKAVDAALIIPISFILQRAKVPAQGSLPAFNSWPPPRP